MDEYLKNMQRLEKAVNPSAIKAIQKIYKDNDYLSQINEISRFAKSPAFDSIKKQMEFYCKEFPFERTVAAIEQSGLLKYDYSALQRQFQEVTRTITKHVDVLFTAIESVNTFSRAINQSGIFDAIASISRNMPAIEAINKLNVLLPIVEPFDYDISYSDDGDIVVDDVTLSKNEMFEIADEFQNTSLEKLTLIQRFEITKKKKWFFFVFVLGCVFQSLFLDPILDKVFDEVRERTGINKIIEKIDIKKWFDEIFPQNNIPTEDDKVTAEEK